MVLTKTREKLNAYFERLDAGKAEKIKPGHVEQVIEKLEKREEALQAELAASAKPEKKRRLEAKLKAAREQKDRAKWLLDRITRGQDR